MAWSATLTSITKDAGTQQVTTVITVNGGTELYTMQFVQGFGDVMLSKREILNRVREFIEKMKDIEAMYAQLKPLEGQEIPLNL